MRLLRESMAQGRARCTWPCRLGSSANNQPTDHDVIACVHKATRADVGQLGIDCSIQVVNLDQAYARSSILARKDYRVGPGIEYSPKRRLQIVGRCQPAIDNLLPGASLQLSLVARSSPEEP